MRRGLRRVTAIDTGEPRRRNNETEIALSASQKSRGHRSLRSVTATTMMDIGSKMGESEIEIEKLLHCEAAPNGQPQRGPTVIEETMTEISRLPGTEGMSRVQTGATVSSDIFGLLT